MTPARKLTRSEVARLGGLARAKRMSPGERKLAAERAHDAWMDQHGLEKLVRMSHQRWNRLGGPAAQKPRVNGANESSQEGN